MAPAARTRSRDTEEVVIGAVVASYSAPEPRARPLYGHRQQPISGDQRAAGAEQEHVEHFNSYSFGPLFCVVMVL